MPNCDQSSLLDDLKTPSRTGHPEWLTYREAMAVFSLKKTNLYGRLSKLVRTRNLPGETKKWSRSDLEHLVKAHTTEPTISAPAFNRTPRPRKQSRRTVNPPADVRLKYL